MQPTTASRYPDAWHVAEDAQERAWLDDWMRGRVCASSLEVCPAKQPALVVSALTVTGSC
jgi:hypothetical protein